jgi:hypothetical protein
MLVVPHTGLFGVMGGGHTTQPGKWKIPGLAGVGGEA